MRGGFRIPPKICAVQYAELAQLEEHGPYKAEVQGSSPWRRTNKTHTAILLKYIGYIYLTGLGVMRECWNRETGMVEVHVSDWT